MAKITAIAIESHDPAKNAQLYKKLFDFNEIAENDRLRRGGEAPQDSRVGQELESIQAFARLMTKRSASSLDLKRSARPPTEWLKRWPSCFQVISAPALQSLVL